MDTVIITIPHDLAEQCEKIGDCLKTPSNKIVRVVRETNDGIEVIVIGTVADA